MPRMVTNIQSSPQNDATPKSYIHHHRAGGTDEHGVFAAETIGEQAVDDLAARIGEQRGRDDRAHVCLAESELFADRTIRDRKIVAAHVERRVEQADESPVQTTARAEAGRMMDRVFRHTANGRENEEAESFCTGKTGL